MNKKALISLIVGWSLSLSFGLGRQPASVIRLGKASANWFRDVENDVDHTVTVHPCKNLAGEGEDAETTLTVHLRVPPGCHPNVRDDQVIGYVRLAGGELLCVSDVADAGIGTIRLFANVNPPPAGWAVCDGTNGTMDYSDSFLVGADGEWDEAGGYLHHGGAENNHADHPIDGAEDGLDFNAMKITQTQTGIDHTETDNRPPYKIIRLIQRID